jgi:hypothetical protein
MFVLSSDWDWLDQSGSPGSVLLCLKTQAQPASEMPWVFFNIDDWQSTKITGLQR